MLQLQVFAVAVTYAKGRHSRKNAPLANDVLRPRLRCCSQEANEVMERDWAVWWTRGGRSKSYDGSIETGDR